MNLAERPICVLAAEIALPRSRGVLLARHHRRQIHHAARLLERHDHVGGAMLQRLERADRHAELLARLHVFDRHGERFAHRPDRFGRERGDRLVDDALDQRQRASRGAEHVLRPDAHVGKGDVGRALAVLGRVAAPRHARRVGVDEKEADPVAVAPAAGEARRHDQLVGAVALADERLLAVQHEGGAVLAGGEPDIDEIEARLLFGMGKAQAQIARRDLADEVGALFGRGGVLQERAAEHDGLRDRARAPAPCRTPPSRSSSRPRRRQSRRLLRRRARPSRPISA